MGRKRWIIIGVAFAIAACSNLGNYLYTKFIEEPLAEASELNYELDAHTAELRYIQHLMAGYELAMEKQAEGGGHVSPGVLTLATQIAGEAELALNKAQSTRRYVVSAAARRRLPVDRTKFAVAEIAELDHRRAVDKLRTEIASADFSNRVKVLVTRLQQEELTWTEIEAMVVQDGRHFPANMRDALLTEEQVTSQLVGEAEQAAKALNQSRAARCHQRGPGCRRTAQDLLERAHRLQQRVDKIRKTLAAESYDRHSA